MSKPVPSQGKGSKRRPGDEEAYRSNWDEVFGKKTKRTTCPDCSSGRRIDIPGPAPCERCHGSGVIPLDTSPASGQAGSL